MLYLTLAVLSSALVSIFMRLSEAHRKNNISMLAVNYVMCTLVAGIMAFSQRAALQSGGAPVATGLGLISGVLYLGSFILLQWNISINGVALSSTFMKLGVLVPTVMTVVVFHESLSVQQGIGIALALAAIVLIQQKDRNVGGNMRWALIVLLLAGGLTDGMSKVYEQMGLPSWSDVFLVFTFLTALVLCVLLAKFRRQGITGQDVLWGLLIGVPNCLSARFLLLSLSSIPAVVAYPVYSVAGILVVSLAGIVFFHERLSGKQKAAMGIILAAIVLLNM